MLALLPTSCRSIRVPVRVYLVIFIYDSIIEHLIYRVLPWLEIKEGILSWMDLLTRLETEVIRGLRAYGTPLALP